MPEKNTAISVSLQELRLHTYNKACGSLFSYRVEETLLKSDSSDVDSGRGCLFFLRPDSVSHATNSMSFQVLLTALSEDWSTTGPRVSNESSSFMSR